jgi:hypothetical protein
MADNFIGGPEGQYNLRFIRRISARLQRGRGSQSVLTAETEDHHFVELYGATPPNWLNETIIPGYATARVVHWVWDETPRPEDISAGCLRWSTTRIIGWRIDLDNQDLPPTPIMVDPPSSNGAYAIEEPQGDFTIPHDRRIAESELQEWGLELARDAAKSKRALSTDATLDSGPRCP